MGDRTWMKYVVALASFVLLAVGSGSIFILSVAVNPMAQETGWAVGAPSAAYGLQFVGAGLGALFVGRRLDQRGMGMPATVGAVMIATGAFLTSQVTAPWQLWLTHGVLLGLFGQATLFAPLMANVTRWFGIRSGWAVGFVASGQSLAGILWPYITGTIIGMSGWREAYATYAVVAALLMLPASLALWPEPVESNKDRGQASKDSGIIAVARQPATVLLSAAIFCCCIAMSMPLAHLVAYGSELEIPLQTAASALSVALGCAMVSRMVALGWVSRRLGGTGAILAFSALQASSLGLLLLAREPTGFFIAAAVFGFGYGGLVPSYPVAIRSAIPSVEVGRATAIVLLAGAIAMGIGGWLAGVLRSAMGSYETAFLLALSINLANVALVFCIVRSPGLPRDRDVRHSD